MKPGRGAVALVLFAVTFLFLPVLTTLALAVAGLVWFVRKAFAAKGTR